MFGRKRPQIRMTVDQCLASVVVRNPEAQTKELPSGAVEVSLPFRKPWVVRMFSRNKTFLRRFELDETGSALWRQIGNRCSVADLVESLVRQRNMPREQATESIMPFLHLLMVRGLVGLVVPQEAAPRNA